MTLSKPTLALAVVAILAGMATLLLLQHQSLVKSREETQSLRAQIERLREENEQVAGSSADSPELEQLRKDQAELLRLRGEVNLLRRELAAVNSQPRPPVQNPPETNSTTNLPLVFTRLRADVVAEVSDGQTLVTGGWDIGQGRHQLVLLSPRITGASGEQVFIQASIVEAPDAVLAELGLETIKVPGEESSIKEVLSSGQAEAIFERLKGTEGVKFVAQPNALTLPGEEATLSVTQPITVAGQPKQLGPIIKVLPSLLADGRTLNIRMGAEVGVLSSKPK
jgi:hypothetical protein